MKDKTNASTDPHIDRTADNKINGKLTSQPQKARQKTDTRHIYTVIQNSNAVCQNS